MTRLACKIATLTVLVFFGCSKGREPQPQAEPRRRFDSIAAKPKKEGWSELCDIHGDKAKTLPSFEYPELAHTPPKLQPKPWRWINVWATWCKPCVEELPLVSQWSNELPELKARLQLVFLSVDADDATMQTFAKSHPEVKESIRATGVSALQPWLKKLGLPEDTSIPLHVFVDDKNQVQCVRAGAMDRSHRPLMQRLFSDS